VAKEITIEEITTALPVMIRASGWFYMEAARALTEDFGAEGERTVRRWLRRWGQWRGRELRKGHMALGLPINVETLCKNWDSAMRLPGFRTMARKRFLVVGACFMR
jgi:hypothetical protein